MIERAVARRLVGAPAEEARAVAEAAAGHVIEGFATFIMGGNPLLGIVIFLVLLIVNFVVITKGAGRLAVVGARFALDGMPGKQLAIDADMAAPDR